MIKDFGAKIGGAKKDLLAEGKADISSWTTEEQNQLVTKDNIWKRPNYQKLKDSGLPIEVVAMIKLIRDAIPTKPVLLGEATEYYDTVLFVKNEVEAVKDFTDFRKIAERIRLQIEDKFPLIGFLSASIAADKTIEAVRYVIKMKKFLYTEEEKRLADYWIFEGKKCWIENNRLKVMELYNTSSFIPAFALRGEIFTRNGYVIADRATRKALRVGVKSKEEAEKIIRKMVDAETLILQKTVTEKKARKKKAVPPQLEHITRIGENYRNDVSVTTDMMLQTFKFRGDEFGNWQSQKDRQANLDMSYDALMDLATAIGFTPEQLSLGEQLAIAYGSRGRSGAVAHYEPDRNVINLTKMKGAGSLAHEWFHALHYYIISKGFEGDMRDIIRIETYPDYNKKSAKADGVYVKESHGYWSSEKEMLARAFACYVKDKLEEVGVQSDYLCGHAETTVKPEGEERKAINKKFDELFDTLKARKII